MLRAVVLAVKGVGALFSTLLMLFASSGFLASSHQPFVYPLEPRSILAHFVANEALVRVVILWTPESDISRQLVEKDLPPMLQRFDQQLQILYVDTNHPNGEVIYQSVLEQFEPSNQDLPLAIIDRIVLQGATIRERLPGLVEDYLTKGGVDWPEIPGLELWLEALPETMSQPISASQCSECEFMATRYASAQTHQVSQQQVVLEATRPYPVVKAVMFWMEGCPHCHEVLEHVLPPIQAKYGNQFQITLIELIGGQEVMALYELAESMGMAKEEVGVPFLVIGDHALIGSGQIPAELPGLIERYLAEGGADFPNFQALVPLLATQSAQATIVPSAPSPQGSKNNLPASSPPRDVTARPAGFSLAILTMTGMIGVLLYSVTTLIWQPAAMVKPWQRIIQITPRLLEWMIIALLLIGLGVAGYLAYVETQSATAYCGPVGDCNAVQQSPYARLFGVLPVGVLGVIGYLGILALAIARRVHRCVWEDRIALAIFVAALLGTLFSLYLTYLEAFVIQAICLWCITSAVIMTLLLLLSAPAAMLALENLTGTAARSEGEGG